MRILILLLALLIPLQVLALEDADRGAMRSVVERQIDAFRRNDAEAAYSFAAPSIQALFPAPDRFMSMVRESYAPVYRPRSYAFGKAMNTGGVPAQLVKIIDERGEAWSALYSFERQPDGSWLITSCQLLKDPEESA